MLVATLLACTLVASPAAGIASTITHDGAAGSDIETVTAQPSPAPEIQTETAPEADTTTTRIAIRNDGSAEWQLTIRMELETDADVDEFSAFQAEFEQNRSRYVGRFSEQMIGVVDNAATATDREMNATEFEGEVGVQEAPRRWGYVTYRFVWDGFAQADAGTITVGDVFQGGYFLESDDILVIEKPDGYETSSINPNPDRQRSSELQWNGPASFANERPQVVFTDGSGSTADETPSAPGGGSNPAVLAVVGLFVVLVVATIAYGWQYRSTASTANRDEQDSGGTAASDQSDGGTADLGELATDRDQVRSLLDSEGGRIRQAEIAEQLDWSPSKTSRVLSDMVADGEVEKLRIGRENVIDTAESEET